MKMKTIIYAVIFSVPSAFAVQWEHWGAVSTPSVPEPGSCSWALHTPTGQLNGTCRYRTEPMNSGFVYSSDIKLPAPSDIVLDSRGWNPGANYNIRITPSYRVTLSNGNSIVHDHLRGPKTYRNVTGIIVRLDVMLNDASKPFWGEDTIQGNYIGGTYGPLVTVAIPETRMVSAPTVRFPTNVLTVDAAANGKWYTRTDIIANYSDNGTIVFREKSGRSFAVNGEDSKTYELRTPAVSGSHLVGATAKTSLSFSGVAETTGMTTYLIDAVLTLN